MGCGHLQTLALTVHPVLGEEKEMRDREEQTVKGLSAKPQSLNFIL